jgi:peroxiredoxin
MALHSHMVPIGTPLPEVTLPNLDGDPVELNELAAGEPLVVMFVCNHCPYVQHVEQRLATLCDAFEGTGVNFVAISSNDVAKYPSDDVQGLRQQVARTGWQFEYLVDTDQAAALAFHAACTPDFFVYDAAGLLAYRGAFDSSNPKNNLSLDGSDLRNAISKVLLGKPVPEPHRPSMGCGIKWKAGNEPEAVSFS